MMRKNHCHCCALPIGDYLPWGSDESTPDFGICDCCGIEYGYEDSTESSLIRFRKKWISDGAKWFLPKNKPKNWSLEKQLAFLPIKLPLGITKEKI